MLNTEVVSVSPFACVGFWLNLTLGDLHKNFSCKFNFGLYQASMTYNLREAEIELYYRLFSKWPILQNTGIWYQM
jgi:hypothetical protein